MTNGIRVSVGPLGLPGGSGVKHPPVNAIDKRDSSLIPGLGRSPEIGDGNTL